MNYIKNSPFITINGKPFRISNDDEGVPEHDANVGEVLLLHLTIFRNNHSVFVSLNQILNPEEIDSYNRVRAILVNEPQEGDYYRFESTDIKLLKKLISWVCPRVPWFENYRLIMNTIEKSPEQLPNNEVIDPGDPPEGATVASNGASRVKSRRGKA